MAGVILESLLYEACGRIISPVHGSLGLMSSDNWPQCQAAAATVLRGSPLMIHASGEDDSSSAYDGHLIKPLQGGEIRHFSKDDFSAAPSAGRHRVKTRRRFKRSTKRHVDSIVADISETKFTITGWGHGKNFDNEVKRVSSHDSLSVQTVEPDLVNRNEPVREVKPIPSNLGNGDNETGLDLTLSLNPVWHTYQSHVIDISDGE